MTRNGLVLLNYPSRGGSGLQRVGVDRFTCTTGSGVTGGQDQQINGVIDVLLMFVVVLQQFDIVVVISRQFDYLFFTAVGAARFHSWVGMVQGIGCEAFSAGAAGVISDKDGGVVFQDNLVELTGSAVGAGEGFGAGEFIQVVDVSLQGAGIFVGVTGYLE